MSGEQILDELGFSEDHPVRRKLNEVATTDHRSLSGVIRDALTAFVAKKMAEEIFAMDEDPHEHEWVDMRNEIIESGEMCLGCNRIRP